MFFVVRSQSIESKENNAERVDKELKTKEKL